MLVNAKQTYAEWTCERIAQALAVVAVGYLKNGSKLCACIGENHVQLEWAPFVL